MSDIKDERTNTLSIEELSEAIRQNPNDAESYYLRGSAYLSENDMGKAIVDFDKAMDIIDSGQPVKPNPDYSFMYFMRGVTYLIEGHCDLDKAIKDFNQAIRFNPNDANSYTNRGFAYYGKKEYDKAMADHNKAIELDPNCSDAYANRGLVYLRKNKFDKAIADCKTALKIQPDNISAKDYLDKVMKYKGETL